MKDVARLREQVAYRPFQPFWLETIGGTRIYVERAEWFWEIPGRQMFVVAQASGAVSVGAFSDLVDLIEFPQAE